MLHKSQMKCYSLEVVGPFWNFGPVKSVSKMSLLCPNQQKHFVGRTSLVLFVVPTNRPHNREKPHPAAAFLPTHLLMFAPMGQLMLIAAAVKAILPLVPSTHSCLAEQLHMLKHRWGELQRRREESASYLRSIW